MTPSPKIRHSPILLLIAGGKGAVASTLAVAVSALGRHPELVLPSLTTAGKFPHLGPVQAVRMAGWDRSRRSLLESIKDHGVLPEKIWSPYTQELGHIPIRKPPASNLDLPSQVEELAKDIRMFQNQYPRCRPVLINLLPAAVPVSLTACRSFSGLYSVLNPEVLPDMAYTIAAIECGVPLVNFTSNEVEVPVIIREAVKGGVPLCGRDGKTGQTYLKVVLASALKARNLSIDGWYSLNLLGNSDGKNLLEPGHAEGKLKNKTELLDEILGYCPGEKYGSPSHKVLIDYYPPRGDAKEAWDVIDLSGLFDLPMSLRLNLQGRDSILAAPLVLDLARWITALHLAGRSGPVPELGFFFKRPVGDKPPLTFQDQWSILSNLERTCEGSHLRPPRAAPKQNNPKRKRSINP
jgi:myo-inositol-1-phosphate synthase